MGLRCYAKRTIEIADFYFLLGAYPHIGRAADGELRPGLWGFPVGEYIISRRV